MNVAVGPQQTGDAVMTDIRWFVGIDWATEKHRVCLLDDKGKCVVERDVAHAGDQLSELCSWLQQKTTAQSDAIGVAIETPRGPVVETLVERGFQLFAINPKQLDRFRDRFTVAGAKDDSRDAHVLADALRTDRHAFRRLAIDDPLVIMLREWSRMRDELTQERTRLINRLHQQLWRYYPQAETLTDDVGAEWFLDLWECVPTPQKAARVSEKTIARILQKHRIRRLDAATVLSTLRQPPLSVAPGTVAAASAHIKALVARLRLVNAQIKQAEAELDKLCDAIEETTPGQICEQRDMAILRSVPGLGRINIAALLAEAGEPLRRRDYHALRILAGSAPVSRRSGKTCIVLQRRACNGRLRSAIYQWARVAMQHDAASNTRYAALRARGCSHGRALRTVGDRLLYVLCRLLERQQLFDPNYNRNSLTRAIP
jgi:transposase